MTELLLSRESANTTGDVIVSLDERAPSDVYALPVDIFRSAAFYDLHRSSTSRAWYITARDVDSGRIVAAGWAAEVEAGHARSPGRGSYGGLQLIEPRTTLTSIDAILGQIESALEQRGVRRLSIVLPPTVYATDEIALWSNALTRGGYLATTPDLSFAIDVTNEPLSTRMNSGNRAIVRTAARKGFTFRTLTSDEREEAYNVNVENRRKRGYPLTMSLDAFLRMDAALPGRLRWYGVFHEAQMIAANVTVVIDPEIWYVFYWGELAGVERSSPVTLLADGIYRECQDASVRLLDIGTATVNGAPNEGLIAYKRNIGCTSSLKFTFSKEMA